MKKIIFFIFLILSVNGAFAQQHEISFGYGYPTAMKISNSQGDAFLGALSGLDLNNKNSGSFNLEYMYNLNSKMAAGLVLGYEHSKMKSLDYKVDFITIMPSFKMNWIKKDIFRFYSKIALGVTLDVASTDDINDTSVEFAYQVSPLGFEVGKSISGFAEIGYGHQGIGLIGIRYRF